jgi:hypothetical protein
MIGLLAMLGCTTLGPWRDTGSVDTSGGEERVVASPALLDFGSVSVNADGYALGTFTLYNLGNTAATVTGHDEAIGSTAFTIASPPVLTLEPGAELTLSVRYAPTTDGDDGAEILIEPSEETVRLLGVGTAPVLSVGTATVDPVVLGCSGAGSIPLTNTGTEDLLLTGATLEGTEIAVTVLPERIRPGESGTVGLSFAPAGDGARGDTVLLTSNDPLHPAIGVLVSGLGYEGERVSETFHYTPSNPTDLLFLIATAGGMTSQLDKAVDAIPLFVQTLRAANIDYQLAALSSDAPCPGSSPGWADRSDTTLQTEAVLERGFGGASGAWEDDLVGLAAEALAHTATGDCLAGFRRADADLQLIVVSDGPSRTDAAAEAATIAANLQDPASLRISALVPLRDTCGEEAEDFEALADEYDGTARDLCAADWADAFLHFAALPHGDGAVRYALAEAPVVSTIEVLAEGVPFETWTWDADRNAVVFDGDQVPAYGAEVTVRYVSAVACE